MSNPPDVREALKTLLVLQHDLANGGRHVDLHGALRRAIRLLTGGPQDPHKVDPAAEGPERPVGVILQLDRTWEEKDAREAFSVRVLADGTFELGRHENPWVAVAEGWQRALFLSQVLTETAYESRTIIETEERRRYMEAELTQYRNNAPEGVNPWTSSAADVEAAVKEHRKAGKGIINFQGAPLPDDVRQRMEEVFNSTDAAPPIIKETMDPDPRRCRCATWAERLGPVVEGTGQRQRIDRRPNGHHVNCVPDLVTDPNVVLCGYDADVCPTRSGDGDVGAHVCGLMRGHLTKCRCAHCSALFGEPLGPPLPKIRADACGLKYLGIPCARLTNELWRKNAAEGVAMIKTVPHTCGLSKRHRGRCVCHACGWEWPAQPPRERRPRRSR